MSAPTVVIPDTSEYQAQVDCSKLGAVILRAHNGHRADRKFLGRQKDARAHSTVRMFYGYVVAGRDPAQQGQEAAHVIGRLLPGEMVWCDLEEGAGDQSGRALAWCREVDRLCGGRAGVYSGEAFMGAHLSHLPADRPRWVAAYRKTEPRGPHLLWQFTDKDKGRGVSGPHDASLFHGTLAQLRSAVDHSQGRSSTPASARHAAPGQPAQQSKPAPRPAPLEVVQFAGTDEVWECVGSELVHVTRDAYFARQLTGFTRVPADHPLSKLPRR